MLLRTPEVFPIESFAVVSCHFTIEICKPPFPLGWLLKIFDMPRIWADSRIICILQLILHTVILYAVTCLIKQLNKFLGTYF